MELKRLVYNMTDIILSSFLSLFALFGKEEQVDEERAKAMLINYLRHQFGIRNIDAYIGLYSDMRIAYEMSEDLNVADVVESICTNLNGQIRATEEPLLLLRLMEFCGNKEGKAHGIFQVMAEKFHISESLLRDFVDFVNGTETEHVMLHRLDGFEGQLKTLFIDSSKTLVFTYIGSDTVLLNDVPVLSGTYQVWMQSSVLKGHSGKPVYYSTTRKRWGWQTARRRGKWNFVDATSTFGSQTATTACTISVSLFIAANCLPSWVVQAQANRLYFPS